MSKEHKDLRRYSELLFNNQWMEVYEDSKTGYVYHTSPWCSSLGIAVLVFEGNPGNTFMSPNFAGAQYLGRYETCPAHAGIPELTVIAGGYDNSDVFSIKGCALNELREEAGIDAKEEDLIMLGTVKPSKVSDNTMYLFALDYSKIEGKVDITGDGSLIEEGAWVSWVTEGEAVWSKDPLFPTMIQRLKHKLNRR